LVTLFKAQNIRIYIKKIRRNNRHQVKTSKDRLEHEHRTNGII
jgi:hypothetical protein